MFKVTYFLLTLATPVDKDLSGEANEVRLSSNSEVIEFRNAFVDEMTKEAEYSQIKLKLGQKADDTNFEYKLSAIITHLGNSSTKCGHYVADVFRYAILIEYTEFYSLPCNTPTQITTVYAL